MPDQPLNGQPPPLSPEAMAAITASMQQSEQMLRAVIGVTLRGLVSSSPGVPPQVLMAAIAWQVGNQMAEALAGELSALFVLRKGFIEAFTDGVQKAKIIQPPPAGAVPANLRSGV